MTKIDKHIIDLLHDNECVIVPKMGGFLKTGHPEDIHPSQHDDGSLSKKIAFNAFLNHNDGLLASYVAQHEKLSYSEALKKIEAFADEFHRAVDSGNKFVIEQAGMLYKDTKGNVQFEDLKAENEINNTSEDMETQYEQDPVDETNNEEEAQAEMLYKDEKGNVPFEVLTDESEINNTSEIEKTQYLHDSIDETRHEEKIQPQILYKDESGNVPFRRFKRGE